MDARSRTSWTVRSRLAGRRARASARSSPSTSTASAATTRPSRRSAHGTTSPSSRMRRSRSARPTAGKPAGGQGALAAFSFNGNKIITTSGGGMLVSRERDLGRARPEALDAGARAGGALRAPRDRVQLPDEQPARGARPGAARVPPRARGGAPPQPRSLLGAARRSARPVVHARGARTGRPTRG